jgi:flagellar biosynthesis/type III secretory pathway protein FliH
MCAQTALDSISQSEAEWIRERNYWDAVMTERTIREEAELRGLKSGMEKGFQQGLQDGMQQGIQQGIQEGLQQGIQQGIQKGIQQKTLDAARSFYNNGASVELIAKSLGMTQEEVMEAVGVDNA